MTVSYDAYGIPHIKGKTRAGMMFGAGWVMARDRGLLFAFGRNPARAAVADVPGLDAFSLVTSATPFVPSREAEALVTRQRQVLVRAYGAEGRQMLRDMANYTGGVNAYYRANHVPIPGGRPFDANDMIAVTAFIGSIFGNGGGAEHENSDLLARLEQRFGAQRGHALWSDAMEANDPDAPVTTHRFFPYPTLTGGRVRGSVVVDPGSIVAGRGPADRRRARDGATPAPRLELAAGGAAARRPPAGRSASWARSSATTTRRSSIRSISKRRGSTRRALPSPGSVPTSSSAARVTTPGASPPPATTTRMCSRRSSACRGAAPPSRATLSYVFRGRCRRMHIFDAGRIGSKEITYPVTVHGPVIGTATVHGKPYAFARRRSTYGQDVLSLGALKAMTEGRATTPQRFWKFANRFGFTFNWAYTSRKTTSFFSSGLLPVRARGLDRRLPTLGTGGYEWRGFLSELAHPHDIAGPKGLLLNWNNKAAPGWMHGDDAHYGSVQHVELFGPWPARPRIQRRRG